MPSSRHTLLRLVRQIPSPSAVQPRVLGVDDFALRKGQKYGTILVDLEQRRPIDLLPERSATTLEMWLVQHPGIEIIARDRGPEYIRGATAGAPAAVQVADRFHLLCNLREALERTLERTHTNLRTRLADTPPSGGKAAPRHCLYAVGNVQEPRPKCQQSGGSVGSPCMNVFDCSTSRARVSAPSRKSYTSVLG